MNNFIKRIINGWAEIGQNYNEWNKTMSYYEPKPVTPKIKLCRDCRYCVPGSDPSGYFDTCIHPKNKREPNLVTGEITKSYCRIERWTYGFCDKKGRHWTPKTDEKSQ